MFYEHLPSFMLAKRSLSWWSTSGPKAKLLTKIILEDRERQEWVTISSSYSYKVTINTKMQLNLLDWGFFMLPVCCVTLCLLSFPSILQTESHLSPADKDNKNSLHVYIQKLSTMMNTTLTVYSPCFFPYHFIHFLNSLSMVCEK